MIRHRSHLPLLVIVSMLASRTSLANAQTIDNGLAQHTPMAATAPTAVPALISFSGAVARGGQPGPAGETSATFLIFKDEHGGDPLFVESQTVTIDSAGQYKVHLGSSMANGLPAELFANGEARWLEVQVAGEAPQPRVLLLSVPYALKAADAATLGGLPASAFALKGSNRASVAVAAPIAAATAGTPVTTTGGTAGTVPIFNGAATIVNSGIFATSTGVGIAISAPAAALDVNGTAVLRGDTTVNPAGTATATAAASSRNFTFATSVFDSATKTAVRPSFEWRAEPAGNNTAAPSATMHLLSSNGIAAQAETGFYVNANGTLHFATGQTFPGTGPGTVTGLTAGTGLTGGGTTGAVTLNVDKTKVPFLNAANTFVGLQTVTGGLGVTGNATVGGTLTVASGMIASSLSVPLPITGDVVPISVGGNPFLHQIGGTSNTFAGNLAGAQNKGGSNAGFGETALQHNTGGANTAVGSVSLRMNTTGNANSAVGSASLGSNTTGSGNTAFGATSLASTTAGTGNTAVGWLAGATNVSGYSNTFLGSAADATLPGLLNATAIGASAQVAASNSIVLGRPGTNVGIGTTAPNQPLTLQRDDPGTAGLPGQAAQIQIRGASDTNQQLDLGYFTGAGGIDGYGTIQALHYGTVYTPLVFNLNGGNVGVGIAAPTQILTVGHGLGHMLADGYDTYSSRRWKTNIQTLPDALARVERLRGVSYDLKTNGKHEIGVIAEEVGAVVPEIVSWEANGKDARGVDYTRLTALLIEAVKEQQSQIKQQGIQLAKAMRQIRVQRAQLRRQAVSLHELEGKRGEAVAKTVYGSR